MWSKVEKRFPVITFLHKHLKAYQVPKTLNFWYAFGMMALLMIVSQFFSGFWLVMFYVPTVNEAFSSIQMLMHQVPSGWFIRYCHTTGASFLFLVMYAHLFRAFLYGSYRAPREVVWFLGMFLWFCMMAEAFMGYVLPWGQMSYWGAQVVTSALDGLPWLGSSLKYWIRGAQQVGQPLLQRFFAFHSILLPFVLIILIKLHIVAIRCVGSTEPIEVESPSPKIPFIPDHLAKESLALSVFITLFFVVIFFFPTLGGLFIEGVNQQPANPLETPSPIHPPWYLTPFFAILRAIPHLGLGLLVTTLSFVIFFALPWLDLSPQRILSHKNRIHQYMVYGFCLNFIMLGILGWYEVNVVNLMLSRIGIFYYFLFFSLMPLYSRWGLR